MKQIFFLAGLPRSGATLLSAILNQNPDMWVSPASPLFGLMAQQTIAFNLPENIDYDRSKSVDTVISQTPHLFYEDKNTKYIIDKNLSWQTPNGLSLIGNYISENPRIVCCVRSIPDILASFDSVISRNVENVNNNIDAQVHQQTFPIGTLADRRAEWLMRYDKDITICLNGMKLALDPEYRKYFHFVEYDNLVTNTVEELRKLYDFLGIEYFVHSFDDITDTSGISDESPVTGIKYLHKVRSSIEKQSRPASDVLSNDTISKYSGLEFWRLLP